MAQTTPDALTVEFLTINCQAALMEDVASAVDTLICVLAADALKRHSDDKEFIETIDDLIRDRKKEAARRKQLYESMTAMLKTVDEKRRRPSNTP